jgi:hypothetical protein
MRGRTLADGPVRSNFQPVFAGSWSINIYGLRSLLLDLLSDGCATVDVQIDDGWRRAATAGLRKAVTMTIVCNKCAGFTGLDVRRSDWSPGAAR